MFDNVTRTLIGALLAAPKRNWAHENHFPCYYKGRSKRRPYRASG